MTRNQFQDLHNERFAPLPRRQVEDVREQMARCPTTRDTAFNVCCDLMELQEEFNERTGLDEDFDLRDLMDWFGFTPSEIRGCYLKET